MAKVKVKGTPRNAGHPTTPNIGGPNKAVPRPTKKPTVRNPGIGPDKPSGRKVGS